MNKIIVMKEFEDREINISLYDYINSLSEDHIPFVVCHVTDKEYASMWQQVYNSHFLDERLSGISTYNYNFSRYLMGYDGNENVVEIANYDSLKKPGSYYLKDDELIYDENKPQFTYNQFNYGNVSLLGIRIYTKETFDDVINHYQSLKKFNDELDDVIAKIYTHPGVFYDKVYNSLTKDEIAYIRSKISSKSCTNCLNTDCLKRNDSQLLNQCQEWNNKSLIAKEKILSLKK